MRKFLLVGISTFALGAAVALGATAYADQQFRQPTADTYKSLELFGDVLTDVRQQYVVPVDDKKLIQSAIDGMLTSLDPALRLSRSHRVRRDARPDPRRLRRARHSDRFG